MGWRWGTPVDRQTPVKKVPFQIIRNAGSKMMRRCRVLTRAVLTDL